jgi:hypothetical protein
MYYERVFKPIKGEKCFIGKMEGELESEIKAN